MTRNLNSADRIVRTSLGVGLGAFAIAAGVTSVLGAVLSVLTIVMLGTAALGSCPLYSVLGISTCPTPHRTRRAHVSASHSS